MRKNTCSLLNLLIGVIGISFHSLSMAQMVGPTPTKSEPQAEAKSEPTSRKMAYADLTAEEREVLGRGEIGTGQYVIGGIVGTVAGLGIGQAIQGRYMPTGLIMTVGELASATIMVAGAAQCVTDAIGSAYGGHSSSCNTGLIVLGYIGLLGFRLFETIDVWATPPSINHRYESLRSHLDQTRTSFEIFPVVAQDNSVQGAGLALQLRF